MNMSFYVNSLTVDVFRVTWKMLRATNVRSAEKTGFERVQTLVQTAHTAICSDNTSGHASHNF